MTLPESTALANAAGAAARKARSAEHGVPGSFRVRDSGLDRLRGLAVVLMVLDHLLLIAHHPWADVLRTVGPTRLAMPLFAVVAGALVYRLSARWAAVAAVGLVLPSVVPWIDSPNILLLLAAGAVVVVGVRRARFSLPVALVVAAAVSANGFDRIEGAYSLGSVVVLMLLGHAFRPYWSVLGLRLARAFARAGRYPLTVYVSHLLVLHGLVVAL